jgi:hypothetical protein
MHSGSKRSAPRQKADTRPALPRASIVMSCDDCGLGIAEVNLSTKRLATELFRLRREHAVRQHAWSS